jgi:predicted hotdog family 3-hydroxylacyl-ACP dehydratase
MAQACGVAAAWNVAEEAPRSRRGVVGAIKGYEYETEQLSRFDALIARVKSDLEGGSVLVCDAELSREGEIAPLQKARITIVFMEGD